MKDRYLFKARGQCSKLWHYGMLTFCGDCTCHIKNSLYREIICDISTLCQCTGLKDKNDKLIWENDICNYYNPEDKDGIGIIKNGYVLWIDGTISMRHKVSIMVDKEKILNALDDFRDDYGTSFSSYYMEETSIIEEALDMYYEKLKENKDIENYER